MTSTPAPAPDPGPGPGPGLSDPGAPDTRSRRGTPLWRATRHPAIRTGDELTLGERAADKLRNGMGSWGFVFGALVFLAGWMIGNRNVGFDKYPFILLNLILSCLAAMQGAILLIAAKREDQISSDLAAHDYATNVEADAIVKSIHALTQQIHERIVQEDRGSPGTEAL